MAEAFSVFFITRIVTFRDKLNNKNSIEPPLSPAKLKCWEPDFDGVPLASFTPASEEEIKQIIRTSPAKSCELDPIPTTILKECLDEIAPMVTHLVNASLRGAMVPDAFKEAIVRPLLKRQHLDKDIYKDYRPVSNLAFISKVLEKVVSARLNQHITANHLADPLQSQYLAGHSTETALVKVHSDISAMLDRGDMAILLMLDLSAAFDTIDHSIMLQRLQQMFGVEGDALDWIRSYLTRRTQRVDVKGAKSEPKVLAYALPQGSVHGPQGYPLYSKPIGNIVRAHGLEYHCYTDDSQIYIVIKRFHHH